MTEELKMQIILLLSNYLMTENTNILDEILTICNNEIRNNNEDAKIYFYRGLCRYNYKLYGEAIRDFNKSLILGFKNEKIYFYIGYCKFHFKQYKEAINDFDKYIKLSKEYKLQYLNMSIKEYKSKNNDDYTLNLLKAFLKNNFGDEYFFRGYCKLQLKDNYGAFEDFNVSIKLNYKNVDSYFYMGHCNILFKEFKKAIEYFKKVIEINPNDEGGYLNIGVCHLELKEYYKSIENFNKTIELNNNNEIAYFGIGFSLLYLKKYEESIKYFNKTIELNKKYISAYLNRGISEFYLKKYNEAIKDFNKTIELNSKNIDAYFFRGIIKIYLKNEKAIKDFRTFFKINKDNNIYIITILQKFDEYNDIEKLFKFIVDIKNNELWENEPITNLISRFEESKNFNDELKENIKYLLLYEYFLLKLLTFDTEEKNNNIEISHYTSLDILTLLLNVKENIKESGNIRINNITTANDPKEGKILESILNKNDIDIQIENDEKALTLQTSYSRNKDSLTMFRLYGKKENKEATGVCLVLDNKYFNNSYISPHYYKYERKTNYKIINELINSIKVDENKTVNDIYNGEIPFIQKRNLYWVLYYNEKENQLIYNRERSKYASNIIDLNDLNDPDYKAELKEYNKKEDIIKYAFAKIFHYTREIKKQIEDTKNNENYKNIKNQLYSYLFENIKYIIKHEAFFEEQELRMLVTNDYKSDEILIDNDNKKLYIDYIKLFNENTNYIKEIIIGSKVENNEAVAEYIRKALHLKNTEANKLDDIKVSISEAPLR